jgi:hypothetical protein
MKNKLLFGTLGMFLLVVFILVIMRSIYPGTVNQIFSKRPSHRLIEKHFNSIESAKKHIKDIPLVVPQKIHTDYEIKDITYYNTLDNNCIVNLIYADKNKNQLILGYYSKDDNVQVDSDFKINPDIVRIENEVNNAEGQNTANSPDNVSLNSKYLRLELPRYNLAASLLYSNDIKSNGISDDEMLIGIIEEFLQSELFYLKTENDILFGTTALKLNSFSELAKNVQPIQIKEPKYIPSGFNFKHIIYERVKNEPDLLFNATAIYGKGDDIQLTINYMRSTPNRGIIDVNSKKFEQRNVYKIECVENGKGILVPYVERQLRYQFYTFDMNVLLQYKSGKTNFGESFDNELIKIVESVQR